MPRPRRTTVLNLLSAVLLLAVVAGLVALGFAALDATAIERGL